MPKFFIKNNQIISNKIEIIGDDVNHIRKVLRMRPDDEIKVCNTDTSENYTAKIDACLSEKIQCTIIKKEESLIESNIDITLFQGVPKFDKMELIIQKNTEVGVKKIVPVMMDRTIVKLDEKDKDKKIDRWRKIAEIAAKQSMRDVIPEIMTVSTVKSILEQSKYFDVILVAYENEDKTTLKQELNKLRDNKNGNDYKIGIVIGPEGGISEKEIEQFEGQNFKMVTLGKRILRTETAGLVMAGNILYELEGE